MPRGAKPGKLHPNWRGGRIISNGYVLIYSPFHPRARSGYVFEHILILEKAFKRSITKNEHIHHLNGKRHDNSLGNLLLFKSKEGHHAYENRLKAFKECGHFDWQKCCFCHKYDITTNLIIRPSRSCHKVCENAYYKALYCSKKELARRSKVTAD
jgi:hypothetical protein